MQVDSHLVIDKENCENYVAVARAAIPTAALPVKSYFDQYILPHLGPALSLVVAERPENPIAFLANHLLKTSSPRTSTNDAN